MKGAEQKELDEVRRRIERLEVLLNGMIAYLEKRAAPYGDVTEGPGRIEHRDGNVVSVDFGKGGAA